MKKYLMITFLLAPTLATAAQRCYDVVTETTPSSRFTENTNGTVSDTATGLMWQTCSYGQSYNANNDTCVNSALRVSWQEALRASVNDRTANFDDWHVPNNKELASILEHSCVTPSINTAIFKGNISENYWTSTSDITNPNYVWVYTFDRGLNSLHDKMANVYLRLVRYER